MGDTVRNNVSPSAPELGTVSESLRQSEERFRLMVEAVKDYAIFLLDPEGHIASWNEGAERIKGYTAEEIIGRHFSIFYPPEALEQDWPAHELEVARKEERFEDEGWRLRKNGSRFWANVVITALYNEDGQLLGFTKVTRDLTERYLATQAMQLSEQALERTNRELLKRNQELQEFAYIASHDLQEPLRKISTFSDLLSKEYEDSISGDGQMYLERIRDATARMSVLINDLLAYSRLATRPPVFRMVDLNRIVEDVVSDLQVRIEETGGQIKVGKLPTIEADPTQMRQLFQNLIGNALKFHKPGVPPAIRISCSKRPAGSPELNGREGYRVVVKDNGIGFDEKYIERIFAPFQRLHTRREYTGTGVGLAICKRIMERHHGSITAHSKPGKGATFEVLLPVHQERTDGNE